MHKRPVIIVPLDIAFLAPPSHIRVMDTLPQSSPITFFSPRPADCFYQNHGATAPPYPRFYAPTPDGRSGQIK